MYTPASECRSDAVLTIFGGIAAVTGCCGGDMGTDARSKSSGEGDLDGDTDSLFKLGVVDRMANPNKEPLSFLGDVGTVGGAAIMSVLI
jgi:hypothetical protein